MELFESTWTLWRSVKYTRKLERKKHIVAALSEVSESLTGIDVRDLFILISILTIDHSL